ncbi:DUF397 domain-containing protein [Streptomyces sp. 6N223]|uniref:DUF397 domain-containing protein n=1 Tax=Streptomyces sp. 6N223 TaxID=3457412 RepID=UPI003FD4738A
MDLTGVIWRKSSYTASNGQCVEFATLPGTLGIAVRDSKHTAHPAARASRAAWSAFLAALAEDTLPT